MGSLKQNWLWLQVGIWLISIWLLFASAIAWHIELPGLYMDAVNPDFQVVDVLQGEKDTSPMLYLPGNLIAGRFPLLTSLYHGTQNIIVDAPVVAVFGASLAALRAAQALFGAAILTALFFLLRNRRQDSSLLLAWLPAAALALDPVFTYAFRTQLYITLGPVAWLLASILAARRVWRSDLDPLQKNHTPEDSRWLMLAGFCFGAAVFGYFIFAFFAPVALLGIITAHRSFNKELKFSKLTRALAWIFLGFLIGISGYIIGYLKIMSAEHGVRGFLEFLSAYQHSIGIFEAHLSLSETIHYFANLVWRVFSNDWQHDLIFGEAWQEPGSALKLLLLLGLPLLIFAWSELRRIQSGKLRLVMGLLACFPIVALIFGNRLSGHHFVVLLPLAYIALATGLNELHKSYRTSYFIRFAPIAIWVFLIAVNLSGQYATGSELLRTHGRHLFSDAINNFSGDAIARESKKNRQHVYFPDWGLYMPFHFLTNGQIRHSVVMDLKEMRAELCRGNSIEIAFVTGNISERFSEMASQLKWTEPSLRPYNDYEGNQVFVVGTFDALKGSSTSGTFCSE